MSVSNFLCAGVENGGSVGVLNVRFVAVGVGHCYLVYGLFPLGHFSTFNEPAGGSGGAFCVLFPLCGASIFDIADHEPKCFDRRIVIGELHAIARGFPQFVIERFN